MFVMQSALLAALLLSKSHALPSTVDDYSSCHPKPFPMPPRPAVPWDTVAEDPADRS